MLPVNVTCPKKFNVTCPCVICCKDNSFLLLPPHILPTQFLFFSSCSRGKCWNARALIWAIKIGFNFILPNFPATLEHFLVCTSNITVTSLAEKIRREQLLTRSFLTSCGLRRPPLLEVATSLATGGGCNGRDTCGGDG